MLTMEDYLDEMQFATQTLIPAIWEERNRLTELEAQLRSLTKIVEDNYLRSEFVQLNAEDPDDVMMGVGMYWENYFGKDKERHHKDKDKEKLQDQVSAHAFSVDSLAGTLLQHAKQGISLTHGNLANCPDGRLIGSQSLANIVWQARNQALHWEDHKFRPPVEQCFDKLAREVNPKFADYTSRNMAADVLDLLQWKDFDSFKQDILLLA